MKRSPAERERRRVLYDASSGLWDGPPQVEADRPHASDVLRASECEGQRPPADGAAR